MNLGASVAPRMAQAASHSQVSDSRDPVFVSGREHHRGRLLLGVCLAACSVLAAAWSFLGQGRRSFLDLWRHADIRAARRQAPSVHNRGRYHDNAGGEGQPE